MDVLPEWQQLNLAQLRGTLLVAGAPDVGKSTFARYLYQRLRAASLRVAYLDGDPGQASLGPPTTMTLALGDIGRDGFAPQNRVWQSFVGSTSPVGHMLQVVVGAARLVRAAYEAGTQAVLYDTTGLVDPAQGGVYLKMAKINLLRPAVVIAIQYNGELEPLLRPLRFSQRVRIVDIPPSPTAQRRDPLMRKAYRAERFAHYFSKAQPMTVNWSGLAVFPAPVFTLNGLVALEDANGFTLGLGIVTKIVPESRQVKLLTPLASADNVDAIHLGDVELEPQTFRDVPLKRE